MKTIEFSKFHGFGNDYIVIAKDAVPVGTDLSDLATSICHRHTGAGSDGIAVIEKLSGDDADFFCEIINPDGSTAGFSGNGTRCAVAFLYYSNAWTSPALRLRTKSGVKNYKLIRSDAGGGFEFEAEIGVPKFSSDEIPFRAETAMDTVIDLEVYAAGKNHLVSCVNVGNPVACVFVDDLDNEWRAAGRELETHEVFPARANIVFVKVIDRSNIELRIWERGAGETSASGTCASGAAVLSAFTGRTDRIVNVKTEGGTTLVAWREDGEMVITGHAQYIYRGEWPIAA